MWGYFGVNLRCSIIVTLCLVFICEPWKIHLRTIIQIVLFPNKNSSLISFENTHNQIFSVGMTQETFTLHIDYASSVWKLAIWKSEFIFRWKQHPKLYLGPPSYSTKFHLMWNEMQYIYTFARRIIETMLVSIRMSNNSISITAICSFWMVLFDEYHCYFGEYKGIQILQHC